MSNREQVFEAVRTARDEAQRFNDIYNSAINDAANMVLTFYKKERILTLRKTYTL